ncbi:hypothetical protein COLU111180_08925 [Cohnella lubricantis]|uniref:Uncharacterized protein n=1 Tax=Cohnella lubricantis TaxID=2163172 RepID=A0A841T5S1_9BACL|nr:hypothetical protein [Cohnella lubricantis]MBB6676883.1 hypothetical protein [Cohnella lubricantis]MBP2118283.1 hypothetical protein [Cohnella lubricantis]
MISRLSGSHSRETARRPLRMLGLAAFCALAAAWAPASQAARAAPPDSSGFVLSAAVLNAESASAASKPVAAPARELESAVNGWIAALSAQKPFAEWKQASPTIEALGPGTHGWLVTLRLAEGRPVGYLVVYAAEDGTYRLGEYGAGSQPLFDAAALGRSLVANGLISSSTPAFKAEKLYLHPFAAVWKVQANGQTYWLDAKTDEVLPLDDGQWDTLVQAAQASPPDPQQSISAKQDRQTKAKIIAEAYRLNPPFDPFERLPWLMNEKPFSVKNEQSLLRWLEQDKQLRYVSEPFGDRMLYALAVIGYERWSNGRIDVALDNEGVRFVPLTALRAAGLFYK